jgi:hypothetical protein
MVLLSRMLLVRTDWPCFNDYLAALDKPARKNYKACIKRNADLTYNEIPFDREEVDCFMRLWERQLVRGAPIKWVFPIDHVEELAWKGELRVFRAGLRSLHFIQKRTRYWECHPPMYDKVAHAHLYIAKFMWFNLIRYAIENRMGHLDLGGGSDYWRDHIRNRARYPNPAYKWAYVPLRAKQDPDSEPDYYIRRPECELLLKGS